MKNPFSYDETERFLSQEIFDMFVEDTSILDSLYQSKHNFLCGDRGTGKSMYLRYLEPYCQFKLYNGWENFLDKEDSFIAFYFCVPKSIINIREFESQKVPVSESIYAHYFNMLITERIIYTIQEQLQEIPYNLGVYQNLVNKFIDIISPLDECIKKVNDRGIKKEDPYDWILSYLNDEKRRVTDFVKFYGIRNLSYAGGLTDYHDYILPIVKLIKELFNLKCPIYFLIDDAGNVFKFQQKTFNSWIANRDHNDLSIKIAIVPTQYTTFLTIDDNFIDGKNDFTYVHLDNYGSKSEKRLQKEIIQILDKRLKSYGINYTAEEFFPVNQQIITLLKQAEEDLKEKVSTLEKIKDKPRYINRNMMRQLYKNLYDNKSANDKTSIHRSYSGIEDIVSFSSHNIRDCLKICSKIFEKEYPNIDPQKSKSIKPISYTVQDNIMCEMSKSEVVGITLYKQQYDLEIINKLKYFIDSLGNLYRNNLLDFTYSENGVTAFQPDSLNLSKRQKNILRIGLENRYFLRRFYTERDGKTISEAYALNKMFFPYYKLELKPFAGRIKFAFCDFENALDNSELLIDSIVNNRSKKQNDRNDEQLSMLLFTEEVEDGIDDQKNNLSRIF